MSAEFKVAKDVAEAEFDRWVDAMDLSSKLDPATLGDEDKRLQAEHKRVIVEALMKGSLVVNAQGEFEFTPVASDNKGTITFYEPTGASFLAADQAKQGHSVAKMYKF